MPETKIYRLYLSGIFKIFVFGMFGLLIVVGIVFIVTGIIFFLKAMARFLLRITGCRVVIGPDFSHRSS